MHNLARGQAGPGDRRRRPRRQAPKLSDYRGKVVALVFWGTWCGPCMREIPRERELVERLKGRPFAMLGVNCDGDKPAALKVIEDERITWPNWHDGEPGTGPIVKRYHVGELPDRVRHRCEGDHPQQELRREIPRQIRRRPPQGTRGQMIARARSGPIASRSPGVSSSANRPIHGRFDPTRCPLASRSCLQSGRAPCNSYRASPACTGEFRGKSGVGRSSGMVIGCGEASAWNPGSPARIGPSVFQLL